MSSLARCTDARDRRGFRIYPLCEPIRFLGRDRCLSHSHSGGDTKGGTRSDRISSRGIDNPSRALVHKRRLPGEVRLNNLRQIRAPDAAGVIGIVGALTRTIGGRATAHRLRAGAWLVSPPIIRGSETKQRSAGLYEAVPGRYDDHTLSYRSVDHGH
jgi:hypothetical protein